MMFGIRLSSRISSRATGLPRSPGRSLGQRYSSPAGVMFPEAFQRPAKIILRRNYSSAGTVEYFYTSAPVRGCENILLTIHETCGTPWWGTIVIAVVSLRVLVTVPFAVLQRYIVGVGRSLKPEMDKLAKELAAEVRRAAEMFKWSEKYAASRFKYEIKRHTTELYVKYNCHPAKAILLPFFQIPLWICLSMALRNLFGAGWYNDTSKPQREDCHSGGLLWFKDFTKPDKTWIIPLLYGGFSLLLAEMYAAMTPVRTTLVKVVLGISRFAPLILVPFAAIMPSAISFYWLVSLLFGLIQFLVLLSPRVLRFFRIPGITTKDSSPYRNLVSRILRKPVVPPQNKA